MVYLAYYFSACIKPANRSWFLSRLFRGKFIAYLRKARDWGKLSYVGQLPNLAEAEGFNGLLCKLRQVEWVVYRCKHGIFVSDGEHLVRVTIVNQTQ